jgi:glycosyltransferase involved in cell wall biosynthesis
LNHKPRVYIVIGTFLPTKGGAETQTFAQARGLRELGHEVTIITFRHKSTWLAHEVIEGVPVMRIGGPLLGKREHLPRPLKSFIYFLAILALTWTVWRDYKHYDVVQVCKFGILMAPLALVCWLTSKPMVVVVLGMDVKGASKSAASSTLLAGPLDPTVPWMQVTERSIMSGDLEQLERLGRPVVGLTRFLLRHIHVVVVILSTRMKAYLADHGFHALEVHHIPNGVDLQRFCLPPGDTLTDEHAHVVVSVSGLRFAKGVDVLLQAWRLVVEQAPSLKAQLVIVGDGRLQAQLECMAKALGIAERVEFTGVRSDIPEQLHRGKIAVLPSRAEGMPNALLEAMACGCACVATRVSGSEDVIQHGINGLLVDVEDYVALADALLTLLHDPKLREKFLHAARETVENQYSLERIVERYSALYQSIAGSC